MENRNATNVHGILHCSGEIGWNKPLNMVDAVQVNDPMNCFDEQAHEHSLSPQNSDVYDVFGDPDIFPRVGEQYQVEIPSLISESENYWFQKNPHDAESTCTFHDFQVGLPIPVIWITDEIDNNNHDPLKHACKSIRESNKIESSNLECNSLGEAIDSTLVNTMKLEESGNSNVEEETKIGMQEKNGGKANYLVPGSSCDTWNEIEEASFTLGLYIFGKNLVQVKRFIGNRKMGDILSLYYGKFYKSGGYRRWSECRKMRSRKCIYGQKIFTGPRQQELLSRLLPKVSEECQNKLHEVSKMFVEGKMLLEDYVLTLKASVGLKVLVEAVGVGKGKEDLTGLTADSMKSTHALPVRPEIPVGKACSMLTPAEIISFLTGNFRLSKARSSDLFWEAVWPRLLARGWHSEQPGSYNYAVASKHPLVFLLPGVKKFSRKLVKGNHYFDSVSDVLGKVALDPELIDLETLADSDCASKEGNEWTKEATLERENSPDQQRHCYLKPRTPNRSTEEIKFTVVDTSLASEKVRELRGLPEGVLEDSTSEDDSDDEDISEEQTKESESVDTRSFGRGKTDGAKASKFNIGTGVSSDTNGLGNNHSKEELPMCSIGSTDLLAASKDQKTDLLSNTLRRNDMKCQSIQRILPDNENVLVPVTKRRRRFTACIRAERNCNSDNIFMVPRIKQQKASPCYDNSKSSDNVTANIFLASRGKQVMDNCCPYESKFNENVLSQETPPEENKLLASLLPQENKTLADPLSNPSSVIGREAAPATSPSGTKDQCKKPLIDLNLPVSAEVESEEPLVTEVTERQQNNARKESDDLTEVTISEPVNHSEHQPDMNTRRKSTRNRPLTVKALEAFAYSFGYLDKTEKRKGRDNPRNSLISRPSQRTRRKVAGETSSSSGADFHSEETTTVVSNGDSNVTPTGFMSSEG